MNVVCHYCSALRYPREKPGMCCSGGTVVLEDLEPPPQELKTLLSGETERSRRLLKSVRQYNSIFQMTSFGADVERLGWESTFRVQGQVSHNIGTLLPLPNRDASFLQIYFMPDMGTQADRRCSIFNGLDRTIVVELQNMLHTRNTIVKEFKTAMERQVTNDNYTIVVRADLIPAGEHQGRFNVPENPEVAALLVGHPENGRDIVIHSRTGGLDARE